MYVYTVYDRIFGDYRAKNTCETPELTIWVSQVSASLLHSFYSLENTTLSLAYFPHLFSII
jgi:hypothetical protein